jgi:hypothetical protein
LRRGDDTKGAADEYEHEKLDETTSHQTLSFTKGLDGTKSNAESI